MPETFTPPEIPDHALVPPLTGSEPTALVQVVDVVKANDYARRRFHEAVTRAEAARAVKGRTFAAGAAQLYLAIFRETKRGDVDTIPPLVEIVGDLQTADEAQLLSAQAEGFASIATLTAPRARNGAVTMLASTGLAGGLALLVWHLSRRRWR